VSIPVGARLELAGVAAEGRRSTDMFFLAGERGEFTLRRGGDLREGVIVTIDCGLDIGVFGASSRGTALGGSRLFAVIASCPVLAVAGVVRRLLLPRTGPAKKGDRPKIGDAGGVAVSCCRFSNLDRRDDTGLIDDSSLPLGLSMLCTSSRLCCPVPGASTPSGARAQYQGVVYLSSMNVLSFCCPQF